MLEVDLANTSLPIYSETNTVTTGWSVPIGLLLEMKGRLGLSMLHSIHMVGVPFPLVAVWLDRSGDIIYVHFAQPGKFYFPPGPLTKSAYILELGVHHLELLNRAKKISWKFEDGTEGP